jgi:hypothetical protein
MRAVLIALAACGGQIDLKERDATSEEAAAEASIDAVEAAPAPHAVDIDAANCDARPITAACADGGVEQLLRKKVVSCGPVWCVEDAYVTLDPVVVIGHRVANFGHAGVALRHAVCASTRHRVAFGHGRKAIGRDV